VFSRNIYNTQKHQLFNALDEHLASHPPNQSHSRLFCAVLSQEDFSPFDRAKSSELRDGIDEIKIPIEKFYLGQKRLVSMLNDMRKKFENRLVMPAAGNYQARRDESLEYVDPSRTIWLVSDRDIGPDPRTPGDRHFIVCYDQLYKNENPYHIFDENKPAWIDHTTIPHTLMGAMLNVTRPWWPKEGKVRVTDPMAGSGTTLLEGLKFLDNPEIALQCSDRDPLCSIVTRDNLTFFSCSLEELRGLRKWLDNVGHTSCLHAPPRVVHLPSERQKLVEAHSWADRFLLRMLKHLKSNDYMSTEQLTELRHKLLRERLIFYLHLRTYRRYSATLHYGATEWQSAFEQELHKLLIQIDSLCELRERQASKHLNSSICLFMGRYSLSCAIDMSRIARAESMRLDEAEEGIDARELTPKTYDVIITDPPYGFNTDTERESLAHFYSEVIRAMVRALTPNGQLILAVPDWSHTGRQLPSFTQKEFVTQQVLRAAEDEGREVIRSSYRAPRAHALFRAPFYWQSERALRRAILHFRFRASPEYRRGMYRETKSHDEAFSGCDVTTDKENGIDAFDAGL
jgi:hypothetical protein